MSNQQNNRKLDKEFYGNFGGNRFDTGSLSISMQSAAQFSFEHDKIRTDSPSKHLNALLGISNSNSVPKFNLNDQRERSKENRSPNLTGESFEEVSIHFDQELPTRPHETFLLHRNQAWSDNLPTSPQREVYHIDGLATQSPDINVHGMAGSLDFLLFTDEKAPPVQSKRTQDLWPIERTMETLNLSSAFSAVDAPRRGRSLDFNILDTASEYSDIQPQKEGNVFHSYSLQPDMNNQASFQPQKDFRNSGEVWRSGENNLTLSNAEHNALRSSSGMAFSRDVPQRESSVRNSWEQQPSEGEERRGMLQLRKDMAGLSAKSGDGVTLRTSRDGGFQHQQQLQQQASFNNTHSSHQDFQSHAQQQQQQHFQQRIPPTHNRVGPGLLPAGTNAHPFGSSNNAHGNGAVGLFRPNVDYDYEPQIDGGNRHQQGFRSASTVGNSAEFRASGRSAQSSSQQGGGFLRYSSVQSSMDSDNGGNSLSSFRNQFHSLDANSNHFYPSGYHQAHAANPRSSRDFNRSAGNASEKVIASSAGGGSLMGSVSLTGNTRQELVESPRSKAAYKEFYRNFRIKEKESVQAARSYAASALQLVGESVKWRVYLEMADLCRRHHLTQDARQCFALVCQSQPRAAAGFLEWSKLEEDCGRMKEALNVLFLGLKVSPAHEMLLARAIRLQERLHNFSEVRRTLGVSLENETLDRAWKSVLEGALFEARVGNMSVAKKLLRFLMVQVPWYGPIYFEAFRLEEKEHSDSTALSIIRKGLEELPRYGPLWFGLLRIMERQDTEEERSAWARGERPLLRHMCREADEAIRLISRELTWKVHFEKAQAQERAAEEAAVGLHLLTQQPLKDCRHQLLFDARNSLVRSLLSCPENLRWKILLAGSRLELGVGRVEVARVLLRRAFVEVPIKSRANVFLECSRLEEFVGNLDVARLLLTRARSEVCTEWKVFLETVLLEARSGHREAAVRAAREAVEVHPGTGRLWAMYIQLLNRVEPQPNSVKLVHAEEVWETSDQVVLRAVTEVPKSGEVWTERARCLLNPLNISSFDLTEAQRALSFAVQFTPQYGDTFIEYARLEMLSQVLLPQVLGLLRLPLQSFLQRHLSEDLDSDLVDLLLSSPAVGEDDKWTTLQHTVGSPMGVPAKSFDRPARRQKMQDILRLEHDFRNSPQDYASVTLTSLHRRCVNADPNYGSVWFECRDQPYDVPTRILNIAIQRLAADVHRAERLYGRAILHFICRLVGESETRGDEHTESVSSESVPDERQEQLRMLGVARAALNPAEIQMESARRADLRLDVVLVRTLMDSEDWLPRSGRAVVKDQAFSVLDFVTGLVDMNREVFRCDLSEETRRKNLFGSDQIIS